MAKERLAEELRGLARLGAVDEEDAATLECAAAEVLANPSTVGLWGERFKQAANEYADQGQTRAAEVLDRATEACAK